MQAWQTALIAVASVVGAIILIGLIQRRSNYFNLKNSVVVITGGSSGIGKSIAKKLLEQGASVALVARTEANLKAARTELLKYKKFETQNITIHCGNVVNDEAMKGVMESVAKEHGGVIDVVVANAGISHPMRFEDMSASVFEDVIKTNVFGVRHTIYNALPYMTRGSGRVVIVSSQAGQVGLYGYTAYSASKFALQGFAQALSMELYTRNIRVSQCYPSDTDTPLLESENKTKPYVTKLLSEASATVGPEVVADEVVAGLKYYEPNMVVGFDGWMLNTVTNGMALETNVLQIFIEFLTLGLWRIIALGYVFYFYWVVKKYDVVKNAVKGEKK